jgi:hypothetical protein
MHRLPISFRPEQMDYLIERARREGASVAEVIRRLIDRERKTDSTRADRFDPIWDIAGMITDDLPLIDDQPVSAYPDRYVAEAILPSHLTLPAKPRRRRRKGKGARDAARAR